MKWLWIRIAVAVASATVVASVYFGVVWVFLARRGLEAGLSVAEVRILLQYSLLATVPALILVGALTTFFLRRSVVLPFRRLQDLVGRVDQEGLRAFGAEPTQPFARLSRGIIGMTQDLVTQQRDLARRLVELEAANQAISAQQQKLIESERLAVLGQLAAGLAHEIGNPASIVRGYLEIVQDELLPASERRDLVARASRELDRIDQLVRQLIDLARSRDNVTHPSRPIDAIHYVVSLLRPQPRFVAVDLRVTAESDATTSAVNVSHDVLVQVLINLLLNAADAMAGRGVVSLHLTEVGDALHLFVSDSGPGIAEPVRATLFQPFVTTKSAGLGTGLGLVVSRQLLAVAGAELELLADNSVQSEIGQTRLSGATFRMRLPKVDRAI